MKRIWSPFSMHLVYRTSHWLDHVRRRPSPLPPPSRSKNIDRSTIHNSPYPWRRSYFAIFFFFCFVASSEHVSLPRLSCFFLSIGGEDSLQSNLAKTRRPYIFFVHLIYSFYCSVMDRCDQAVHIAICNYLRDGTYPLDAQEKNRAHLRRRCQQYKSHQDRLYRRRNSTVEPWLEVLHERNDFEQIRKVHEEFQLGVDSTYANVKKGVYRTRTVSTDTGCRVVPCDRPTLGATGCP